MMSLHGFEQLNARPSRLRTVSSEPSPSLVGAMELQSARRSR